jgi:hypothetical protein
VNILTHNLLGKSENLFKVAEAGLWTSAETEGYEKLDRLLTEAMLKAERSISKKFSMMYQWSPRLKEAIHALTYWKLRLSQLKGKAISGHTLTKLFKNANLESCKSNPLPLEEVIKEVRQARAALKEVHESNI